MEKYPLPIFSKFKNSYDLVLKNNKPINSDCANYFHLRLKEKTGINVLASRVSAIELQISIYLWIDYNESSERFMRGRLYHHMSAQTDNEIMNDILSCLKDVAEKYKFKLPKVRIGNNIYLPPPLSITVISLPLTIKIDILWDSAQEITKMLKEQYPEYNVVCIIGTEKWDHSDDNHMFLFLKSHEIDKARDNGDLESIKEKSFEIIKKYDTAHMITRENYRPFIKSRDKYSSEKLRNLFQMN